MKKLFYLTILLLNYPLSAWAENLLTVYDQAKISDPVFQQAIAQRTVTADNTKISYASLLPEIFFQATPTISHTEMNGSNTDSETTKSTALKLSLNQSIFNMANYTELSRQRQLSKAAEATLNAALQQLIIRVSQAYFNVLLAEDNVQYSDTATRAFRARLKTVKQEYKVGLKTDTEVFTAQAAYDAAHATEISNQNQLAIKLEKLRILTGKKYHQLAKLKKKINFNLPKPQDINAWATTALQQNWSVKAAIYNMQAAKQQVKTEFSGHYPTISLQADVDKLYSNNHSSLSNTSLSSSHRNELEKRLQLNLNVPIYSGGATSARVHQAQAALTIAEQQLEAARRNAESDARQSYLNVVSGLSQVHADEQTIKSTESALKSMIARYQVGTETLLDVLNQRERLFQAQTQYASDRYTLINQVLVLKQAAGTLSLDDLRMVNTWLS